MILIQGGIVKTMSGPDLQNGQILLDGSKIIAVGTDITLPQNAEVLHAEGCLITPGFIDAHTHIGLHESAIRWEGNDNNENTKPLSPELQALDGINPRDEAFAAACQAGVTTAAVTPGSANIVGGTACAIKLTGNCIDDMVIKTPVAMKAAFGENPKNFHGQKGRSPVTRMAIASMLRTLLNKTRNYARDVDEANADATKKRPFDAELEAMLPVIRKEIPLKVHAHRADDILTAIRIAREFDINLTLDHVTEGHLIVPQLQAANFPVLVGPSFGSKSKTELKDKSFATPGILSKAGLSVCLITDAPVTPLHYLPLCAGLAVRAGMTEDAAWHAITINPAKVLGIADTVGSLDPGKDADIAIFDGNPLTDIQCRTRAVFINGQRL